MTIIWKPEFHALGCRTFLCARRIVFLVPPCRSDAVARSAPRSGVESEQQGLGGQLEKQRTRQAREPGGARSAPRASASDRLPITKSESFQPADSQSFFSLHWPPAAVTPSLFLTNEELAFSADTAVWYPVVLPWSQRRSCADCGCEPRAHRSVVTSLARWPWHSALVRTSWICEPRASLLSSLSCWTMNALIGFAMRYLYWRMPNYNDSLW